MIEKIIKIEREMRGKKEKELRWLGTKKHKWRSCKREKTIRESCKIRKGRKIVIQEGNNIKV